MPKTIDEVIDRLIVSEYEYLKTLRLIISAFLHPMVDGNLMSQEEADAVFRDLPKIRETHVHIQALLQNASNEDTTDRILTMIASGLQNGAHVLRSVYVPFLRGRNAARDALRDALRRPEVSTFVQRTQEEEGARLRTTSLEDLLDTPLDYIIAFRDAMQDVLNLASRGSAEEKSARTIFDIFTSVIQEARLGPAPTAAPPAPSQAVAPPAPSQAPEVERAVRKMETADAAFPEAMPLAAEAAAPPAQRWVPPSHSPGAGGPSAAEASPLKEAMKTLDGEEKELFERLASTEHREMFESFLGKKRELESEEFRLSSALEEHEEALAQLRARLANPPASVLPSDPQKAQLYLAWKRALADRDDLLRQARRRKHELMRDLKARHETQVVLLEMERRTAVEGLKEAVMAERRKAESYREELARLDEQIATAREAMKRFREEFEQLRVTLLIDRMAKSTQVANLAERRRRLAEEAEEFRQAVEQARQRVAAEEASQWEARLAEERAAGERQLADERAKNEAKLRRIRDEMAQAFDEGFRPILEQAEKRHREEMQRVDTLRRQLLEKEEELRRAQASAARLGVVDEELVGAENGQAEEVPAWKKEEFERLKREVAEMWEELEIPPEDVMTFLSECDMLAPFHPKVLELYQEMYRRLNQGDPELEGPPPVLPEEQEPVHPQQPVMPPPEPTPEVPVPQPPAPAPVLEEAPRAAVAARSTRAAVTFNSLASPIQPAAPRSHAGSSVSGAKHSPSTRARAASPQSRIRGRPLFDRRRGAAEGGRNLEGRDAVSKLRLLSGGLPSADRAQLSQQRSAARMDWGRRASRVPPSMGGWGGRSREGADRGSGSGGGGGDGGGGGRW